MIKLICPSSRKSLIKRDDSWQTIDGQMKYSIHQNVVKFLQKEDEFYEGSYLNRVRYLPSSEKFIKVWPLWLISNGYIWEVRKQFREGSVLLELGCASGVDYFGKRYNMIGLDLSMQSLIGLQNYKVCIQADASVLPLGDKSVDGIISSYFWEHIPPIIKDQMLVEFKRVLKPNGKLVFLYDVESENSIINLLKKSDKEKYNEYFIDIDGHLGYETLIDNKKRFLNFGFELIKHFGMERTWVQSNSVFQKISFFNGGISKFGKFLNLITRGRKRGYLYTLIVRTIDETVGKLFSDKKSRIIISVFKVK
jgi:ubiquinone/menaquinone biosynthesis C-methylase UbiE